MLKNFLPKKAAPAAEQKPSEPAASASEPKAESAKPETKAEGDAPAAAPETPGIEDRIAALEQQNTELQSRCATLEDRVTALEAASEDETEGGGETDARDKTEAPKAEAPKQEPKAETPVGPKVAADAAPKTRNEFLAAYNAMTDPVAASRYFDAYAALLR